ncbi:MAG TPA: molybdopterin-dependent oxidoreductase [Planctomycetaceae bacterium]|nr:molybdopterin-dependent oxidoreductase [Planctomycetaceae bacterium]
MMSPEVEQFLTEHASVTRRFFLNRGVLGLTAIGSFPHMLNAAERDPELQSAIDRLETWLTKQADFNDVSRGTPKPHSLSEERRKEAGLTRETWKLEVVGDPDDPVRLRNPLTAEKNTAFDFKALMDLAKTHAVRFPKIMTCLNIGCPLGTGIWEGVPLREVLWLTQPGENLRRIFYYGYHNDDPQQMFRSSLPAGRVLEEPYGLPPVILCYKLNGEWLTPERGAPVRVVVPEAYGFKSIKWLTHLFLSNRWTSNDTYGEKQNDVDSPLKTFCETISIPTKVKPGEPIPVTGYAQVGISGLSKVQVWIHNDDEQLPAEDKYFTNAPWGDAEILPVPKVWGGDIADNRIPPGTAGFDDQTGQPKEWPLRLTKAHWAVLMPSLPEGKYTFRCRTIDGNSIAQPLPRPFAKSGRAAIQQVAISVGT